MALCATGKVNNTLRLQTGQHIHKRQKQSQYRIFCSYSGSWGTFFGCVYPEGDNN